MPSLILACGRILSWYSNVQTPGMTLTQITACRSEGAAVLQLLKDTFPVRNICLKQWLLDVEHGGGSASEGEDEDHGPKKGVWTFPKAHGMGAHVHSTPLVCGNMQNVSAQIIENMHLKVKDAAKRSNQKHGWELQLMVRYLRESDVSLKTWSPPTPTLVTQRASDEDLEEARAQESSADITAPSLVAGAAVPKSWNRSNVRASFRSGAMGTALRYPVWKCIVSHWLCTRTLVGQSTREGERSLLMVMTNTLKAPDSELCRMCPDMVHLPMFLAKYVCGLFHATFPESVPDPCGLLSHQEIYDLNNMACVVGYHQASGMARVRPQTPQAGRVAPFNVLRIAHPHSAGQVR